MKIDSEHLQKLAHLARIEIEPKMEADLVKDMQQIISWVEKLDELDTDGVEPLMHMSYEKNIFRQDEVVRDISKEEALKNAPERNGDFFSVPKVLHKKNG
jgi:aspartyl-tRNA(Asn)/glutamyl-tRNA(Gln) amidotransferase subunit C